MKLGRIFFLILVFVTPSLTQAQKEVEYKEQTWLAYFNQTRLTSRSGIWLDLHWRLSEDFLKENSLGIARLGYTYYITDQVRATVGYAHTKQYSHVSGIPDIPEHRPWQQVQWFEKKSWFTMMQYIRMEERFRRKV